MQNTHLIPAALPAEVIYAHKSTLQFVQQQNAYAGNCLVKEVHAPVSR